MVIQTPPFLTKFLFVMSDYVKPPSRGTYRIKIPASNVTPYPLYMELDSATKIVLVRSSTKESSQKASTRGIRLVHCF